MYLCTVQLVILIYIYHFPNGNLSVKIDFLFVYNEKQFLLRLTQVGGGKLRIFRAEVGNKKRETIMH